MPLPPLQPKLADATTGSPSTDSGFAANTTWEKTVDCLIAEDSMSYHTMNKKDVRSNECLDPISSKILETILVRLGCLCVVVHNGEEAIRCTMGEIAFDVIFMDMLMPICEITYALMTERERTETGSI